MKQIQLTQGKVTLVDNLDYEWLNQSKYHGKYALTNETLRLG